MVSANQFLQSAFTTTRSVSIDVAKYFVGGHRYVFAVTLCNFLDACGFANFEVRVQNFTGVPLLQFAGGADARSIKSKDVLSLFSMASVATCGGNLSSAVVPLSYVWTIQDAFGSTLLMSSFHILSDSVMDPNKLVLLSFSLRPLARYVIWVTVKNLQSMASANASVPVVVQRGSIAAVISGGSAVLLRTGEVATVDASASYDEDIAVLTGSLAGLQFDWTIVEIFPSIAIACPVGLSVEPTNPGLAHLNASTLDSDVVGNLTCRLTVVVSDAMRSRSSSKQVMMTFVPPGVPLVYLSGVSVSSSKELRLSGSVGLEVGQVCTSAWNVDDEALSLADVAKVPLQSVVKYGGSGLKRITLIIGANSLAAGASYTFTLSCGRGSASALVAVLSPPRNGQLYVNPSSGVEMDTLFELSTSGWISSELPLNYQIGFISAATGAVVLTQSLSASTYSSTNLPAGPSSSGFNITCVVYVVDSAGSQATAFSQAHVTKAVNSVALMSSMSARLSSTATADSLLQSVAVISGVMNSVNCSNAPNCTALNRAECSSVSNTCGACLSGYIGTQGADNSACITIKQLSTLNRGSADCSADASICAAWQFCDAMHSCQDMPKSCPGACSGHGVCGFQNVDTGAGQSNCGATDASCTAKCSCVSGFAGSDCSLSAGDMQSRQDIRQQLSSSVKILTSATNPRLQDVVNWANMLSSVTSSDPAELTSESSSTALTAAVNVAVTASELSVPSSSITSVLLSVDASLDSILTATSSGSNGNRRHLNAVDLADVRNKTLAALDTFGESEMSNIVQGLAPVDRIQQRFRSRTVSLSLESGELQHTVSIPSTLYESAIGKSATSVRLNASTIGTVNIYQTNMQLLVDPSNVTAHPIRVIAQPIESSAMDDEWMTFAFAHVRPAAANSSEATPREFHNVSCNEGQPYSIERPCASVNASVVLACNGSAVVVSMACPVLMPRPACGFVVNGQPTSSSQCVVDQHNSTHTICSCKGMRASSRRRLSTLPHVQSVEVVSMFVYAAVDFAAVFTSAKDFSSSPSNVQKVIVVIAIFGAVWGIGFAGMMYLVWGHVSGQKNNKDITKVGAVKAAESPAAVVKHYLDSVVPEVFLRPTSLWQQTVSELWRHHRYINFLHHGAESSSTLKRFLNWLHFLTLQTLLLFLIAVWFDIDVSYRL